MESLTKVRVGLTVAALVALGVVYLGHVSADFGLFRLGLFAVFTLLVASVAVQTAQFSRRRSGRDGGGAE